MSLHEEVSRMVLKEHEAELASMPEKVRKQVFASMVRKLQEKSQDELIRMISKKEGTDPKIDERLNRIDPFTKPGGGIMIGGYAPELAQEKERLTENKKMQEIGIETDTDLPAGDIEYGFSADRVEGLSRALSKHYGKNVTVFRRGNDLLYIDPADGVVKRANPNMLGALGAGITMSGDFLGTVGGGVAGGVITKSPTGVVAFEAVGSGLGTAVGEFIRLSAGKAMGTHDLSVSEMAKRAGLEGGKAAAITASMGGLYGLAKGVNNFVKARMFTQDDALRHGLNSEQGQIAIDEVNKITGKEKVKGTLYQKTNDPAVGAAEADVRGNVRHAPDFAARDRADQAGLTETLDHITTAGVERQGTGLVRDVAAQQSAKRITDARGVVASTKEQLENEMKAISQTSKERTGQATKVIIAAKQRAAKRAENKAWDEAREVGGYNYEKEAFGIDIPAGKHTLAIKSEMERKYGSSFTNIGQVTSRRAGVRAGEGAKADLADLNAEISAIKDQIRKAYKSTEYGTPQIRDMEKIVHALEKDRASALIKIGRGDLLEKIKQAEAKTYEFNRTYRRSVIGDLTAKNDNGVPLIKSKDYVDQMLKGTGEEADQLIKVIGSEPSVMNMWREGIADAYKRDVIDKMRPYVGAKMSPAQLAEAKKRTADWIQEHSGVLDKFFSKSEINQIQKTGSLAAVVKKQTAQVEKIIRDANTKWGRGKLKSMDTENLIKFVTNDTGSFVKPSGLEGVQSSIQKIKYVKNITKNNPAAWREFQADYRLGIRNTVFDTNKGMIDPKKLNDLVTNRSKEIIEIAGEEYYKNLVKINVVSKILSRKAKSLGGDETTAGVIQALRSGVAPPLTRRGRAFTALIIFNNKAAHNRMAEALLNPSSMKEIAKLAEHNAVTRRTLELAMSLGMLTGEDE